MARLPKGRKQRQTRLGGIAALRGTIPAGDIDPMETAAYEAPKAKVAMDPVRAAPLFYGKPKIRKASLDKVPGKRRVAKPHSPRAAAKHFERFIQD